MRKELSKENWSNVKDMNVEGAWDHIKKKICEKMEKHIPKTKVKETKRQKPCWMNPKVFRKIKKKYYAYKRYLVTKQGKEYEQYIKKRNECTREIKKAKKKHERK